MKFKHWLLESVDLQVGKVLEIPEQGNRSPFHVQIIKIQGDTVWLRQISMNKPVPDPADDMGGSIPFKMTRAAVSHFVNDLTGKVDVKGQSDDPYISKVLSGQATYLGKGDDGVVFDAGDMVVKVSTTVPYQPTNPYHRSPSQAAKMLFMNARLTEQLRKQGVSGILPTYAKVVGDKVFVVMPKVAISKTYSRPQLKEVENSIKAIHAAGYSINDEIQVGVWNGHMYHYDLGKMAKAVHKDDQKDDWSRYDRLVQGSGFSRPEKEWEYLLSMLMFFTKPTSKMDEEQRRRYIRKLIRQKQLMDREYPERKAETQREFEQATDNI